MSELHTIVNSMLAGYSVVRVGDNLMLRNPKPYVTGMQYIDISSLKQIIRDLERVILALEKCDEVTE